VCEAIDRHGNQIIDLGETILHHPNRLQRAKGPPPSVAKACAPSGLGRNRARLTGRPKGRLRAKTPGPRLAFIGELDSLRTSDHPLATRILARRTAAATTPKVAGMLGVAMGLSAIGASEHLAGELVFFAVPARSFIDVEERLRRKEKARSSSCSASPSWSPRAISTTSTWR